MLKKVLSAVFLVGCVGGSSSTSGTPITVNDAGTPTNDASAGTCTDSKLPGSRTCVPGRAKANTQIQIAAEGTGCTGCGTTLNGCTVNVKGTDIELGINAKTCPLGEGVACAAACGIPQVTCDIPPLAAGTYAIKFADGARSQSDLDRQLVVANDATDTSCTLSGPGGDGTIPDTYSKSCTDGDDSTCSVVTTGDVCGPCVPCAQTAVATSEKDKAAADFRQARAQCPNNSGAACAACLARTAKCVSGTCVLQNN